MSATNQMITMIKSDPIVVSFSHEKRLFSTNNKY